MAQERREPKAQTPQRQEPLTPQKNPAKNAGPSKEGGFMKQLFKTSFAGMQNEWKFTKNFLVLILICLAVAGIVITTMITIHIDREGLMWGSMVSLVCLIIPGIAFYYFVRSLIVNVRFRKVFGFWAPLTYEGKNALQILIDQHLWIRQADFQISCNTQENILNTLERLAKNKTIYPSLVEDVVSNEKVLAHIKKEIKRLKKIFWSHHGLALNKFLPISFTVLKSMKEYETLHEEHLRISDKKPLDKMYNLI